MILFDTEEELRDSFFDYCEGSGVDTGKTSKDDLSSSFADYVRSIFLDGETTKELFENARLY